MNVIALILVIVGALNWGSIGLFGVDFVASLFGGQLSAVSRVIFTLVGLAVSGEIVRIFILSAHASAILGGAKDLFAEKTSDLSLKRSVVNCFGLGYLTVRPFPYHVRRSQTYSY